MLGFRRPAPGASASDRKPARSTGRTGRQAVRAWSSEEEIGSMSHAPTRWSIKGAVFAASLAVVFAACSGSTASPSASGGAAAGLTSYPPTGDAPCGVAPYTGNMKKITAIDALTVEFQLCSPDASFLPKVAFSAFGIQDSDYLAAHVADGSILRQPNGTGPYIFKEWSKGNRLVWTANPDYWGDKAKTPTLELHWSDESAARLLDLQSGNEIGRASCR